MRILRAFAIVVCFVCAVGLIMSIPILRFYQDRSAFVQRTQVDASADALFGDSSGTPLGSPQILIIEDPKAFLPGTGAGGSKLVSENYLTVHKIYPLQLRTVKFYVFYTRIGLLFGLLISLAFILFSNRRPKLAAVDATDS